MFKVFNCSYQSLSIEIIRNFCHRNLTLSKIIFIEFIHIEIYNLSKIIFIEFIHIEIYNLSNLLLQNLKNFIEVYSYRNLFL